MRTAITRTMEALSTKDAWSAVPVDLDEAVLDKRRLQAARSDVWVRWTWLAGPRCAESLETLRRPRTLGPQMPRSAAATIAFAWCGSCACACPAR